MRQIRSAGPWAFMASAAIADERAAAHLMRRARPSPAQAVANCRSPSFRHAIHCSMGPYRQRDRKLEGRPASPRAGRGLAQHPDQAGITGAGSSTPANQVDLMLSWISPIPTCRSSTKRWRSSAEPASQPASTDSRRFCSAVTTAQASSFLGKPYMLRCRSMRQRLIERGNSGSLRMKATTSGPRTRLRICWRYIW